MQPLRPGTPGELLLCTTTALGSFVCVTEHLGSTKDTVIMVEGLLEDTGVVTVTLTHTLLIRYQS